nr:hypothetical protein [Tanacetum cinerariifolium]
MVVIENLRTWGADEELSDRGSPRVIVYGYNGLPMLPIAPTSPDYIPGLEEPQTPPAPQDKDEREPIFIQPHDPKFASEPIYTKYIPLEDEHILSGEEQPLPPVVSPTAESPGYVAESDPEEDLEEYEDDETEDGPVDYPMDGGDDGDDDDSDSSRDDADDEDEEEEEEHLAPADFAVDIPTDDLVAPTEGTEPAEFERLPAMPTPSPSPLTSLSPSSAAEHLARCTAPAALPSPLIPPPLHMSPPIDCRDDVPETKMPPHKRLCFSTLGSGYEVGESSTARPTGGQRIDYGDTWIDPAEAVPEIAPMTIGEVNTMVTEFAELHEYDTHDLYALLEDAQDKLRDTDRRRQEQLAETLRVMGDMIREMGDMSAELLALRGQPRRGGQPGEDARVPNHQDAPRDADRPSTLPNNTNPNNMTPESVLAIIDQALLRNSTNRDGSHSSHEENQRNVQIARSCFYVDFMKCQPLSFKGTKGMVGLTRWIEKTELVFQISGCAIENQVKFATCTLLDAALTWWNSEIRSLGPDAYSMTWEVLKKKMTNKYCPQGEIKRLEIELWNLKVKENNVSAYTKCFKELNLICTKFVADETKKIDKYVSRLLDNIYGSVKSSNPKTLDETIELANDLMDQKLCTYTERQNVAKVYNIRTGEKKPYSGNFPKCTKCHFHHNGPCTQKCHKCNKGNGCFECGATGHFKRDCPKLKNKDGEKGNAPGWVYVVGNAEKRGNASMDPDSNVITGTFLLNNRYASILFDTGADRSFISTVFSFLIDIVPIPPGNSYDVKLADGKIVGVDTIMRGCTLNFLNHPFNIDLMLVELGSFDVIIDIDWLRRCHAVIVCDEKLVQIPYGNDTLTFHGNESNDRRESRLTVISCSKAQEYMAKGCQIFIAQISTKKEEDKSEGKQFKNVQVIQDYHEVFPEDFPGLPPARLVEFQIDLIPGAAPVARAPYRLAPSKMKELSEQLQELSKKDS